MKKLGEKVPIMVSYRTKQEDFFIKLSLLVFLGHMCVMYHLDHDILKNISVFNLHFLNPHTCHKYDRVLVRRNLKMRGLKKKNRVLLVKLAFEV